MSLCITLNIPDNYVIIASDGRTMQGNKIIRDDHKKLTKLTNTLSFFCSGVQDYCEELRSIVANQVNVHTPLQEVTRIVQKASLYVHERFVHDYPTYYQLEPIGAALATMLAFYDLKQGKSGFIKFCHSDGFQPHITTTSEATLRGVGQVQGLDYLVNNFNPYKVVESVLDTFDFVAGQDKRVGGTITLHILSKENITEFERGEKI